MCVKIITGKAKLPRKLTPRHEDVLGSGGTAPLPNTLILIPKDG